MPAIEGYIESDDDRAFKHYLKYGPTGPKERWFKQSEDMTAEELKKVQDSVTFYLPPRQLKNTEEA